jgi:hypothetical protein
LNSLIARLEQTAGFSKNWQVQQRVIADTSYRSSQVLKQKSRMGSKDDGQKMLPPKKRLIKLKQFIRYESMSDLRKWIRDKTDAEIQVKMNNALVNVFFDEYSADNMLLDTEGGLIFLVKNPCFDQQKNFWKMHSLRDAMVEKLWSAGLFFFGKNKCPYLPKGLKRKRALRFYHKDFQRKKKFQGTRPVGFRRANHK